MGGKAIPRKVVVNDFSVGTKLGDNVIVIAMTRYDAGFLKEVLRDYEKAKSENDTYTLAVCKKLLKRMDECFP